MTNTRVAVAQFESDADVAKNRETLVRLVEEAARGGASLVMFHELATTNYFCYDDGRTEYFDLAEPITGPTVTAVAEAARRTGTSALLPFYEVDNDKRFNTVAYIGADSGVHAKYRKLHMPGVGDDNGQTVGANESFYFTAGDEPYMLPRPISGLSVGTSICYDRHFPEGSRSYALLGADLIFVPTASYRDSIIDELWKAELQTMAFQNSVYVAGVNKVGPVLGQPVQTGLRYPGLSMIIDPQGRVLAECGDREEVAFAEVDPLLCAQIRDGAMRFIQARRPELYSSLGAEAGEMS
ncbi:carbon-nitrogen hydrolase family protein [Nocardia sp. NPDC004711]